MLSWLSIAIDTKTNLTPPLLIEESVPIQESERSLYFRVMVSIAMESHDNILLISFNYYKEQEAKSISLTQKKSPDFSSMAWKFE
jgi:hypothetical protein